MMSEILDYEDENSIMDTDMPLAESSTIDCPMDCDSNSSLESTCVDKDAPQYSMDDATRTCLKNLTLDEDILSEQMPPECKESNNNFENPNDESDASSVLEIIPYDKSIVLKNAPCLLKDILQNGTSEVSASIIIKSEPKSCHNSVCDDSAVDSDSVQFLTDIEDGEIHDSDFEVTRGQNNYVAEYTTNNEITTTINASNICRFYSSGRCSFGITCKFAHIETDTSIFADDYFARNSLNAAQYALFNPYCNDLRNFLNSTGEYCDSWERGLREAKNLILAAKEKKEKDFEFENKKLYLNMEESEPTKRKVLKHSTQSFYSPKKFKYSKSRNYSRSPKRTESKSTKKHKSTGNLSLRHSKDPNLSQTWNDPWRRSRSRNRSRSRSKSSSSSASSEVQCSSECSLCSSEKNKSSGSERRNLRHVPKLDRVYARTLSPKRSRKLPRYKSQSLSPPRSLRSRLNPQRPQKSPHKSTFVSTPPSYKRNKSKSPSIHRRNEISNSSKASNKSVAKSVFSKLFKSGWESCGSDVTISSIACTSSPNKQSPILSDEKNEVPAAKKKEIKKVTSALENQLMSYFRTSTSNDEKESSVAKPSSNPIPNNNTKNLNAKDAVPDKPTSSSSVNKSFNQTTHSRTITFSDSNDRRIVQQTTTERVVTRSSPPAKISFSIPSNHVKLQPISNGNILDSDKNSTKRPQPSETRTVSIRREDCPPPKKPKVVSAAEMELLRYVKSSSLDSDSEPRLPLQSKPASSKKKTPARASLTTKPPLTRREMLIKQLKAVELALAKKKKSLTASLRQ